MRRDDSWFENREGDPLKEWLREGTETLEDPDFDDRIMAMVSDLPTPVRERTSFLWVLLHTPVVRRVAATALVSVLLVVLLGPAGVEILWSAAQSVVEAGGQSTNLLNRGWLESSSIHEWLSVTILLLVLWLLDQTMATVRHRVQPGS